MLDRLLSDRYKIIRNLATGGMGQVYLARDIQRPGMPTCVVKQLRPLCHDSVTLTAARRLFHAEAEILEQLGHHPCIPRLLAYFECEDEFFLVEEFVEGQPLHLEMPAGHPWSEAQVLQFLQEALAILEFVHDRGVIHRDIKPQNFIRRCDGSLVLIDFGSVKQVQLQRSPELCEASLSVGIGTPGYVAPESAGGKPRFSSDLFALGMSAIRALTGLSPAHLPESERGEVIWRDRARVSPALAEFLTKLVQPYFPNRFSTATEARQALEQLAPALLRTNNSRPRLSQLWKWPSLPPHLLRLTKVEATQLYLATTSGSPKPFERAARMRSSSGQGTETLRQQMHIPNSPSAQLALQTPNEDRLPINIAAKARADRLTRSRWSGPTIAIAMASTLLGLSSANALYNLSSLGSMPSVEQLDALRSQQNYEGCIQQAQTIPAAALTHANAQTILNHCRLDRARQLAGLGRLRDAILAAS